MLKNLFLNANEHCFIFLEMTYQMKVRSIWLGAVKRPGKNEWQWFDGSQFKSALLIKKDREYKFTLILSKIYIF